MIRLFNCKIKKQQLKVNCKTYSRIATLYLLFPEKRCAKLNTHEKF